MKEIWKDVVGFEGFYQVSSLGRVRAKHRIIVNKRGKQQTFNSKILKSCLYKKTEQYFYVDLCKNNTQYRKPIHHIVLEAFVGNRPEKSESRHLDNNPQNNAADNLVWGTKKENGVDRSNNYKNHRNLKYRKKLSDTDVLNIRNRRSNGEPARSIWIDYPQVSLEYIFRVCYKRGKVLAP